MTRYRCYLIIVYYKASRRLPPPRGWRLDFLFYLKICHMSILSPKGFEGIHLTNIILEEKRTCCFLKKKKEKKSSGFPSRSWKTPTVCQKPQGLTRPGESPEHFCHVHLFWYSCSPHQTFPARRFPHEPAKTWSLHREFFSPPISSNSPPPTRMQTPWEEGIFHFTQGYILSSGLV